MWLQDSSSANGTLSGHEFSGHEFKEKLVILFYFSLILHHEWRFLFFKTPFGRFFGNPCTRSSDVSHLLCDSCQVLCGRILLGSLHLGWVPLVQNPLKVTCYFVCPSHNIHLPTGTLAFLSCRWWRYSDPLLSSFFDQPLFRFVKVSIGKISL